MNRVAVTGLGIASPLGCDVESFQRRMFAGRSGVRSIRGTLVPAAFPVPYAGTVRPADLGVRPTGHGARRCETGGQRLALLVHRATAGALSDVTADLSFDAVVYGTTEGVNFETVARSFAAADRPAFDLDGSRSEAPLEPIARLLRERGHSEVAAERWIVVDSACASGNQAIGLAFDRIRRGEWQRAIVGAADARVVAHNLMSFFLLGALITDEVPAERASRPFSSDRRGFVRSEAAATLVLESHAAARARGARVRALVRGFAHTNDSYHLTEGRADGSAAMRAMAGAIADAGLEPRDIDAISAHGTATRSGDRLETRAIKGVFGDRAYRVPVTALKSQLGHTTVAAGAVEAVGAVAMLDRQTIAPTINFREDEVDPACDLDYVPNRPRRAALRTVLSNSFGFGGHNACIVLEAGD